MTDGILEILAAFTIGALIFTALLAAWIFLIRF